MTVIRTLSQPFTTTVRVNRTTSVVHSTVSPEVQAINTVAVVRVIPKTDYIVKELAQFISSGTSVHTHEFAFSTPLQVWDITHNLGYRPNVIVEDGSGEDCFAMPQFINENRLTISFGRPTAGKAYLR